MSPAQVQELDGQLQQLGKQHEFHVYPAAEHGFFNDTNPGAYKKDAAEDAWRRTLAFFREHLARAA